MTTEKPSNPSHNTLQRKLEWLTLFRTIAITLLFGVAFVQWVTSPNEVSEWHSDSFFYLVVGAVYASTLVYGLVLRWRLSGEKLAYAQVLGDVVLASCLIFLTGGIQSPFTFTFSVAIVAAALLLGQKGALVASGTASIAFVVTTWAMWSDVVQGPYGRDWVPLHRMAYLWATHILAQFLIAALASYFAKQLTATGVQLKAREADLKELVQLQNQIVRAMPSGLLTCDPKGQITFVNPAAAAILGVSEDIAELNNIADILPELLRFPGVVRRAELPVETAEGRKILGLAVTHLEGGSGSRLIVFQDLTGLRAAEEALRRADHLASLGQLSAQMAHEIRNPLASMRGAAQMLAAEQFDRPSSRLANILVRESDRLSALLDDFLRFARPPPPRMFETAMDSLVGETVEMLRRDPLSEHLTVQLELEPIRCWVDPDQFRQVLVNLLRNAFAAAGEDGTVKVRLTRRENIILLSVWDSAGSIAASEIEKIFDPFYSTKESGTGLGLSTTHSIVAAHGGKMMVSSSPKVGTEFVVELPYVSEGLRAHSGG